MDVNKDSLDLNKDSLLNGFTSFIDAKRKQALYLKLFFLSATIIVIAVLYYAYSIANHAMDKIIVVSTGGGILPIESSEQETLYRELLTSHCYSVSYYVNSFNVNNIKNNQARAAFLVNQADLNAIIGKYQYDKSYSDAINKGVVYQCNFNKIETVQSIGNGSEYQVVFSSTLDIIDNVGTSQFKVVSAATAIRVTPRYPENPTGWYFKNYSQEYYSINKEPS